MFSDPICILEQFEGLIIVTMGIVDYHSFNNNSFILRTLSICIDVIGKCNFW